ncbi:hypothetical protein K491DRAFT_322236 [Lophiostoma macrostomum CBS 122681]|uniref:Uncharacterized protein n=1 Tax=Lophiostoma macrostomum CBS 122681 TaxID=1314788 RepID=A0A6A6SI42_9PLEO|nr:hypothetical protein K491DRAFT_322236 [Lophiostoma macrostomum CBS 122681]
MPIISQASLLDNTQHLRDAFLASSFANKTHTSSSTTIRNCMLAFSLTFQSRSTSTSSPIARTSLSPRAPSPINQEVFRSSLTTSSRQLFQINIFYDVSSSPAVRVHFHLLRQQPLKTTSRKDFTPSLLSYSSSLSLSHSPMLKMSGVHLHFLGLIFWVARC